MEEISTREFPRKVRDIIEKNKIYAYEMTNLPKKVNWMTNKDIIIINCDTVCLNINFEIIKKKKKLITMLVNYLLMMKNW